MSQPRRRRRRRRKTGAPSEPNRSTEQNQTQKPAEQGAASGARRRRRRGRPRTEGKRPASPKSSEDLVRSLPKDRPATLTAPPDGQTLEGIIGELQSRYGVPQYPQEYRITIKVADERDARPEQPSGDDRKREPAPVKGNGPRREKAPAAPVLMREGSNAPSSDGKKRRRGRRGRRRRGGSGGGSEGGSTPS